MAILLKNIEQFITIKKKEIKEEDGNQEKKGDEKGEDGKEEKDNEKEEIENK